MQMIKKSTVFAIYFFILSIDSHPTLCRSTKITKLSYTFKSFDSKERKYICHRNCNHRYKIIRKHKRYCIPFLTIQFFIYFIREF